MFFYPVNIDSLISAHFDQNLDYLSNEFKNHEKRINFEEWLYNNHVSNNTASDSAWDDQVIKLICLNTANDHKDAQVYNEKEDKTLAKLIHQTKLSSEEIISALGTAHLPATYSAVFDNLESTKDLNLENIIKQASEQNNLPFFKALAAKKPEEFGKAVISMIKTNQLEKIKYIAKHFPEVFQASINRKTVLQIVEDIDLEMMKFISQNAQASLLGMVGRLIVFAIKKNNLEMIELLYQMDNDRFKKAINSNALLASINNNQINILEYLYQKNPEGVAAAIDAEVIATASFKCNTAIVSLLYALEPSKFKPEMIKRIIEVAVQGNNLEVLKLMAEKEPEIFKTGIDEDFLRMAAGNNNLEMLQFIGESFKDIFPLLLNSMSLEAAIKNNNVEMVNYIYQKNPTLLKSINPKILVDAAYNQQFDLIKFIIKKEPDYFKNSFDPNIILWAKFHRDEELINIITQMSPDCSYSNLDSRLITKAIENNNFERVKYYAELAPEAFKIAVTSSHFMEAIKKDNLEFLKYLAKIVPKAFEDSIKSPQLKHAVKNNNFEMVKYFAKKVPQSFKDSIKSNHLRAAAKNNNFEMFALLNKTNSKALKEALHPIAKKARLNPPTSALHWAVHHNNMELIKFIYDAVPSEFQEALMERNSCGVRTPIMLACYQPSLNIEMMRFLISKNPAALTVNEGAGFSTLTVLKAKRPQHYQEALELIKLNLEPTKWQELIQTHKTILKRKCIGQAFHLDKIEKTSITSVRSHEQLWGYFSETWFNLMHKELPNFKELYPNLFNKTQMTLLKQVLDLGANDHIYSKADKVKRIKKGLPVILNTGWSTHAVSILIWKDQFIICNRGTESRKPVDAFHFDPLKMNEEILNEIESLPLTNGSGYNQLFFTKLYKELSFDQNDVDQKMNEINILPLQTMGNCTFISPVTAVYTFILLSSLRGINEKGQLSSNLPQTEVQWNEVAQTTLNAYQTWLAHVQLSFLERVIKTENINQTLGHEIIEEALQKAHLLPLEDLLQKHLNELTNIYLSKLDASQSSKLNADLLTWKEMKREPLL